MVWLFSHGAATVTLQCNWLIALLTITGVGDGIRKNQNTLSCAVIYKGREGIEKQYTNMKLFCNYVLFAAIAAVALSTEHNYDDGKYGEYHDDKYGDDHDDTYGDDPYYGKPRK